MRRLRLPSGGLWRHADFMKLWTGQSISEFGSQVSQLAIPWIAAVGLHASPLAFSLLGVLGFLPFILFALPAGVWVDRLRRRPILISGDAARGALLVLIPVLWAFDALRIWQLLVLTFVIGIFTVFFDVAYQSYLPSLVERDDLIDGNSKLQLTVSVAQVAGPSAAGGLIAAITAPYALLLDALSFMISAIFMLRIRKPETVPRRAEGAPKPKSAWPAMSTGSGNERGASGYESVAHEASIVGMRIVRPTPSARCIRLATSAPAIEPTDPTPNTTPTSTADRCRERVR
jgi:MFS family permease